jgi:hypothetical protein
MRVGMTMWAAGLLLAAACNKGKSLIDEARKQHDSGSLDGALATLAQVRQQAPETPEVNEASALAVTWLVAAADAVPAKSPASEQRAKEALSWDPQSGAAQARVCRAAREAEAWEALRKCLEKDLSDKRDAPTDVVASLRDALVAHDAAAQKEMADAERRSSLLASDDEAQWETLQREFPRSSEATAAAKKLALAATLCGDLGRYWSLYDQLKKDTAAALSTFTDSRTTLLIGLQRAGKSTLSPEWGQGLDKLFGDLRESARATAVRAHDTSDKVHVHRIASGELFAQRELEAFFKSLENSYLALVERSNLVENRPHVEQRIHDWSDIWDVSEEAVFGPARTKIIGACKK